MNRLGFLIIFLCSMVVCDLGLRAQEIQKTKDEPGTLRGSLSIGIGGVQLANVGPVVVYLDPIGQKSNYKIAKANPRVSINHVSQKFAQFVPDFVIITAGETLEFPNNDKILHNVFSYSKLNAFDLGLYPKGTSKSVKLEHPGVVHIYCSIHKNMNATIFVAPTPFYARVKPSGAFEIAGIPIGDYHIKTWNAMLPEIVRNTLITPGEVKEINIVVADGQ